MAGKRRRAGKPAKRRAAQRSGKGNASSGRKRARRSISKIERSLRNTDRAVKTLGRERVKSGPISLGKTRSRVAGRRGVRSVSKLFELTSSPQALKTFTYTITVKGPDGRVIHQPGRQVIPRLKGVRDKRKIVKQIEREIWHRVEEGLQKEHIDTDPRTGKRVKLYESGVIRTLRKNVTFQVELFAEV